MHAIATADLETHEDPAVIAAVAFDQLAAAWNHADGDAFGALFAEETDFVNIRGEHHRGGRTMVSQAHQAIFDTIYAGSTVQLPGRHRPGLDAGLCPRRRHVHARRAVGSAPRNEPLSDLRHLHPSGRRLVHHRVPQHARPRGRMMRTTIGNVRRTPLL